MPPGLRGFQPGNQWGKQMAGRQRKPDWSERFWDAVDKSGECWIWIRGRTAAGYGKLSIDHRITRSAHRFSWELANGPIPEGLCVLHRCDNPPCVRPDHLFLGTLADNSADRHAKGRNPWGERSGSNKLTADDVYGIIDHALDGIPYADVARKYGICKATIGHIMTGRIWKDLPRMEPASWPS